MKSITFKIVFSLLLLIEFYPIEAESKCCPEAIINTECIIDGKPVVVTGERAKAVVEETNETMSINLNWINEGKVNINGNSTEWEITKAIIIREIRN